MKKSNSQDQKPKTASSSSRWLKRIVRNFLCKIGIHKYKYNLVDNITPERFCIRYWQCIYCKSEWYKRNGKELSLLKNNIEENS